MSAAPIPEPEDAQVIEARFDQWRDVPVTPEHAEFLTAQALDAATVKHAGIFSVTSADQLPEEFAYYGDKAVPSLVFPWRTVEGATVPQLRPDTPIFYPESGETQDDARKYVFPKGNHCAFGVVNDVPGDTVVIVEGTKQSLVAGQYLPDYPVYAIPGCRGWFIDGSPTPDLWVVAGKDVVVIFDGDLVSNPNVYAAGEALTEELKANGASSVKFAKVTVSSAAGKRNGIDDILAKRPDPARPTYLEGLVANAKKLGGNGGIPRPKAATGQPGGGSTPPAPPAGTPDRPTIVVNDDRFQVMRQITQTLADRWDRNRLFNYGKVISLRTGFEMKALSRDAFAALIAEAALTGTMTQQGFTPSWPDTQTLGSCLTMADSYASLDKLSRVPFVRADGSICQTPGYDEDSRTYLHLDDGMAALNVPEHPTQEQAQRALAFLRDEWLVDFMPSFPEAHDKANMLALILTPFVRGLVPLVPLAVINGREAGVGKNKLLDTFQVAATGTTAEPLGWNRDDDEIRKAITGAFGTARDVFAFDEAHHIESATLARAITAITYSDRILGSNSIADYPNRVTWVALGNGVAVVGDMSRRVYQIRFSPVASNPMDRSAREFVHEDPVAWTLQHRPQILEAALTMIRAWFAAGRPLAPEVSFGSFEAWTRIIGGVLHHAGVEGFLGNLKEFRSETDYDRKYWAAHLRWLHDEFRDGGFTAADATKALKSAPEGEVETPPRPLDDVTAKGYSRSLGAGYSKVAGRDFGGLVLVKDPVQAHGHVLRWRVVPTDRPNPAPETGPRFDGERGDGGMAPTPPHMETYIYTPCPSHTADTKTSTPRDDEGDIYISPAQEQGGSASPRPPTSPQEPEAGVGVTSATRWVADEAPTASPVSALLPLAYEPTERDLRCKGCKGQKCLVPPANLWLACPTCHPSTFQRD